jgi:PAS domain S-box-containing protein
MKNVTPATLCRYLYPVVAVVVAYVARITLEDLSGPGLPMYVTFYPVVAFVAVVSGLGPALVATFTTAILAYFVLLTPPHEFVLTSTTDAIGLAIFVGVGIALGVVGNYYLRLRTNLNEMVSERTAELHRQTEELARSNEELQREKERFSFHTENAPMAVIEWDADFVITRWTGEAENIFGWSSDETVGRKVTELGMVYEEDTPLVESTIRRLTDGVTRKVVASNRNYTKGGEVIYCTWHNTVLADEQGRMVAVMSLVQNVTEQTLAEIEIARLNQHLQRSLDDLQAILQTVPIGLAIAEDPLGLTIRGNPSIERLYGLHPNTNLSLAQSSPPYRVFINGREPDLLELPMQRAVRGENVSEEAVEVVRPDGRRVHLLCNAVALYDEDGGCRGAVGAFLDVTKMKRAEERTQLLAETAARLLATAEPQKEIDALCTRALALLECHVFFNYLTDTTSGGLRLNACAGIPDEEARRIERLDYGVAVCGCVARDARPMVAEDVANSCDERTDLVRGYGVTAYACNPLIAGGKVLGTLSFGSRSHTSFTEDELKLMKAIADLVAIAIERERDRQNLKSAHALLEKQVLERTADLQDALKSLECEMNERIQAVEDLRQNERLMNQQSRLAAMGEMISNIAHQWRQPLNTLGLLIQRLPIFYDSDIFTREFVVDTTDDAMKVIQHMSATIDDFRDFFKPDKEQTTFSVERAINQAISLIDVSLKNHDLCIDVQSSDNAVVRGFPNEFSQVILNILLNSRDALMERKVEPGLIRICSGCENNRVFITVSDNAGGIPEEIIDRIFEPYFTTKGPDRGTGIGLFMAKSIIEQNHGGRLTVRNGQNGAEFRIEI